MGVLTNATFIAIFSSVPRYPTSVCFQMFNSRESLHIFFGDYMFVVFQPNSFPFGNTHVVEVLGMGQSVEKTRV